MGAKNNTGTEGILLKDFDYRYLVTKVGKVYSLFGSTGLRKSPHLMSPNQSKDGYLKVTLTLDNGKRIKTSVHRILAVGFLGLDFNNKNMVVNHRDGNKSNNKIDNLEVVTKKYNSIHAAKKGLYRKNCKMKFSKKEKKILNDGKVVEIDGKKYRLSEV